MLDLALGCHLRVADPAQQPAIRARHAAIKTREAASQYISEVETMVHSRRRFSPPQLKTVAQTTVNAIPVPKTRPVQRGGVSAAAVLALVALMVAAGFLPNGWNLVLITLAMVLILVVIGLATTHRPLGFLINERNLMSLSRFQMSLWTVVVMAAYFTFALARIKSGNTGDALAVAIDWHLWALLGISTTSLVGTPLLLNTKKDRQPAPTVIPKTAALTSEPTQNVAENRQGILYANSSMDDARLTDMFEGDELGNTTHTDLAKVQMFYFTIIAVVAFYVMTFKAVMLNAPLSDPASLPLLPDGLVAVLGISHAGYLTSKGISHTKTQP
jgi:hypothetical protein